ncbi:MAG: GNAT family N-acetyltransferase [Planctomycetota bacterium]|jgi:ribosomal protein S18 acetylase RimI-like enzyme
MDESTALRTLRIRAGREDDIVSLVRLEKICFKKYYEEHRFGEAEFAYYMRSSRAIICVATLESVVTGYVAGLVRRSRRRLLANLDSIAVLPGARGQGICGRLLRRFMKEAKEERCARVVITVAVDNKEGMRYFMKRGFCRIRLLRSYYGRGLDGVVMVREL